MIEEITLSENPVMDKTQVSEIGGSWHKHRTYEISYIAGQPPNDFKTTKFIDVCGVISGCGLAQIHGISEINQKNFDLFKSTLEKIKADYKDDGAGCIMATLGMTYYNKEDFLLELGFVKVSEYSNYRHGTNGQYKQRMYLLTY